MNSSHVRRTKSKKPLLTGRRLVERELALANDRLRLAMESGKSVGWDWDIKSGRDTWFGDLPSIFGIPSETHSGSVEDFHRRVHRADVARVGKAVKDAMKTHKPYAAEFRILRPDGTVCWVAAKGKFYYSPDGTPERMLGIAVDVTDRKQAEETIAKAARRLIEAQEQERKRIARELHDNTNQRLALLAVEIEEIKSSIPDQIADLRTRIGEVHQLTLEISDGIQSLAHELHSSKLDYLGLVAAMKGFCDEFSQKHKVKTVFANHDMPGFVSPDVSLCLFRVLQEALNNAAKHSGVKLFDVQLWGTTDEIHLTVSDSGSGFDLEAAIKGRGLGLISMQERLELMGGTLLIETRSGFGTAVHARVSVSQEGRSMAAAE